MLIAACKKDRSAGSLTHENISLANAKIIQTGSFTFYSENSTNGIVKIYKQPDGKYELAPEEMHINESRDLALYLSTCNTLTVDAINFSVLKL